MKRWLKSTYEGGLESRALGNTTAMSRFPSAHDVSRLPHHEISRRRIIGFAYIISSLRIVQLCSSLFDTTPAVSLVSNHINHSAMRAEPFPSLRTDILTSDSFHHYQRQSTFRFTSAQSTKWSMDTAFDRGKCRLVYSFVSSSFVVTTAIGPADLLAISNGYIHHCRARDNRSSFVFREGCTRPRRSALLPHRYSAHLLLFLGLHSPLLPLSLPTSATSPGDPESPLGITYDGV